jgi:serine/threonine protein kinase
MSDDQEQMFDKIKRADWEFEVEDWKHVSDEAKDLIRGLLEPNPDSRMSAKRALRSKWIKKDEKDLSSRDLSQGVVNLKERRPRLQILARAFMAMGVATKKDPVDLDPVHAENDSVVQLT